jgi:hypothetical protein
MVQDVVKKIKIGKAVGLSGVVAEMLKTSEKQCIAVRKDLMNHMIREGRMPRDWSESFIVNFYKGKGDTLERGTRS